MGCGEVVGWVGPGMHSSDQVAAEPWLDGVGSRPFQVRRSAVDSRQDYLAIHWQADAESARTEAA